MLVHKQLDDLTTQKIILYGTLMLLLFYLMKFLKRMSNRTYYLEDCTPAHPIPSEPSSSRSTSQCPPRRDRSRSKEDKKRRRRRRHHRYVHEEWLPKNLSCHEYQDYDCDDYDWREPQKNKKLPRQKCFVWKDMLLLFLIFLIFLDLKLSKYCHVK